MRCAAASPAEALLRCSVSARVSPRCRPLHSSAAGAGPVHAAVAAPAGSRIVDEAEAKNRLAAISIPVPAGKAVPAADVESAAADIGYPITLKALGHAHKSETGAVRVGLRNHDDVVAALAAMPASESYLVESTVTDVIAEVLVAVRRDPPIGWLITLGFGGVTTEIWGDVTHLLAPVTADDVRLALTKLRSYPLLSGFRGRPAADIDALVALVVTLSDAIVGTDVVEVELNPVLVGREGATAVDALWLEETE